MIKNLITKLLGGSPKASSASRFGARQDVPFKVHKIDRDLVDERALDVVETLQALMPMSWAVRCVICFVA